MKKMKKMVSVVTTGCIDVVAVTYPKVPNGNGTII